MSNTASAVSPRQEAITVCNDALVVFRDCYAMAAKGGKLAKALVSKKVTSKGLPEGVAEHHCEMAFETHYRIASLYRKDPAAVTSTVYSTCVKSITPQLACDEAYKAVKKVKMELENHFADSSAYPENINHFTAALPDGANVEATELNERFYRIKGRFDGCGWSYVTSSEMAGMVRE